MNAITAPTQPVSHGDRFGVALLFSLMLHAIVILGIGFSFAKPAPSLPTLDVTLINTSNADTPDKADFLAQANNAGGGSSDKAHRPGAPFSGPLPVANAGIAPTAVLPAAPAHQTASDPHVVATSGHADRRVADARDTHDQARTEQRTAPIPIPQRLEMARLAQEVKREQESYARRPRRKYISANTRNTAFAAYQVAWVHRIERIGNLNYPEAARLRHLHGNVMLTVVLGIDGHVRDITVNQGSGHRVLDEAAIRIVHLAAPFPRVPEDRDANGNRYNELVITRTWQFLPGDHLRTRGVEAR